MCVCYLNCHLQTRKLLLRCEKTGRKENEKKLSRYVSMKSKGESNEEEMQMFKDSRSRNGTNNMMEAMEGGGSQNPARIITKAGQERTASNDGQMNQTALLSLSSHSRYQFYLSEDHNPSCIPQYTPSVIAHASVCPRFDW